jgi:hypothetical protein
LWPVADLKAFLSGHWQIDRTIVDRRLSISGELTGEAEFTAERDVLIYHERGRLSFGAREGPTEQSYSFEFPDGNTHAIVRFRDGRTFHDLDLSQGPAVVSHACDPDQYDGCFVALDQRRWKSCWKVVGPRKNLEIVSLYTRLA